MGSSRTENVSTKIGTCMSRWNTEKRMHFGLTQEKMERMNCRLRLAISLQQENEGL